MAQPLLRKTLSRLRSKERLRSKKAAAAPQNEPVDPPLELPDDLHLPSEPKSVDTVLLVGGCQKSAAITVSQKQIWAKFTWSCQEDSHNRRPCRSFSPMPQAPVDIGSVATGPNKNTDLLASYPETCNSSLSTKYSNQGAYLQTLEKSSRQWVLSTGKTQEIEEAAFTSTTEMEEFHKYGNSQGEIWYNPIPEDEDLQLPSLERKCGSGCENRNKKRNPIGVKVPHECIDIGSSLKAAIQQKCVKQVEMLDNHQSETYGKVPVAIVDPEESSASATLMTQNTNANKKSHSFSKAKSPGPVRSLSIKMKKLPELRRKLSLCNSRPQRPEWSSSAKDSGNVISRYHLDSSVVSQQPVIQDKAARSGGYLSDNDSPELLTKPEACLGPEGSSFWLYSFAEQPSCLQNFSGLVSIHLLGIQGFKPPKAETKEFFCILQVDSVNKARTALLPCQASVLTLNHFFQLELEDAQLLKMVVFSYDPIVGKNRVCCHGTIILPQVFQGCRTQQLALQLEPRGLLYIKLTLVDRWDPANSEQEPQVFGVKLNQLVKREGAAIKVPLLIQKCITQIEKRGLKAVGLYRLCGSAAVKKELRDAFERDSAAVVLSEDLYPDINVITGILKDYLRELPTPLITDPLYQVVLEAMSNRTVGLKVKETTTALLNCLPEVEKVGSLRLKKRIEVGEVPTVKGVSARGGLEEVPAFVVLRRLWHCQRCPMACRLTINVCSMVNGVGALGCQQRGGRGGPNECVGGWSVGWLGEYACCCTCLVLGSGGPCRMLEVAPAGCWTLVTSLLGWLLPGFGTLDVVAEDLGLLGFVPWIWQLCGDSGDTSGALMKRKIQRLPSWVVQRSTQRVCCCHGWVGGAERTSLGRGYGWIGPPPLGHAENLVPGLKRPCWSGTIVGSFILSSSLLPLEDFPDSTAQDWRTVSP